MEGMGEGLREFWENLFPNFAASLGSARNDTLMSALWISAVFPVERKKNPKNQR
jgi:hypothetical protein